MAHWVLRCPRCDKEITHSEIPGGGRFDPYLSTIPKPEFPKGGLKLECPHCNRISLFQRYQLTIRG
jgi:phage FluMu protein Com